MFRNRLFLTIVLLLALAATGSSVHAGIFGLRRPNPSTVVIDADTLIPGTTYYYPNGLQSAEGSWYNVGPMTEAPSLYGWGLSCDSLSTYDSLGVLTIKAIFGFEGTADTAIYRYGADNVAENWTVWSDSVQTLIRTQQGRIINSGLPVHEKRRYEITTTDTLIIDKFYEIPAKP